jgi:hypothetical protein
MLASFSRTEGRYSVAPNVVEPVLDERNAVERNGAMSSVLIFTAKWKKWYRVLHYRKGFGLFDSVRFGLWLARS